MGVLKMSDLPDAARRAQRKRWALPLYDGTDTKRRMLFQMMPNGIWSGRRCFIVGGGPSLKGFDFSRLKGEIVVTVNRGFESAPFSAINVAQDPRLWGWYERGDLGEEARQKFNEYKGLKCWVNAQSFPFPEDLYLVNAVPIDGYEKFDIVEGVPCHGNSGANAIMVAACLGANPIYLLGFDCKGENGRTADFHAGYPESDPEKVYDNFLPDFKDAAWRLAKKGVRVVNLNPDSAIRCFEFGRFEEIKPISKPVYVSFFTKNTAYEREIKKLELSLIKFGLEYDFLAAEDNGSWRANIHGRIKILRDFLDKYPGRDIVYIDADGIVVRYPDLFESFQGDFGLVKIDRSKYFPNWEKQGREWFGRWEYLGGTMYLKNNARMRALLDLWERLDAPLDSPLSQCTLIKAIEQSEKEGLKVVVLPDGYCQIFDIMGANGEPVVEHFQASRRSLYCYKKQGDKYVYEFGGNVHK